MSNNWKLNTLVITFLKKVNTFYQKLPIQEILTCDENETKINYLSNI